MGPAQQSREIMDAVEHGTSFVVTRGGTPIGELVPLRRRRTVSRERFAENSAAPRSSTPHSSVRMPDTYGLLDTSVLIMRGQLDHSELPDVVSISAVSLAELSAGPHHTEDPLERARRMDVLQRAEAEFDPLPFDVNCARASVAIANRIPLYTTNPSDFAGLEGLLKLRPVTPP